MGKTRSLVTAAFLAAVLVASKFALDGLPNIELVSLLVILYTLEYPWLAVPPFIPMSLCTACSTALASGGSRSCIFGRC